MPLPRRRIDQRRNMHITPFQVIPRSRVPINSTGYDIKLDQGEADYFDWFSLIPYVIHPLKVTIIEAMMWLGQPLSSKDLEKILLQEEDLSSINYHVKRLERDKVLEEVSNRPRRGAEEKFYFFAEVR